MPNTKPPLALALQSLLANVAPGAPAAAAAEIVRLVLPHSDDQGAAYLRQRSLAWLTQLLASQPGITLPELTRQLLALGSVAPAIQRDTAALSGRLVLLVRALAS